MHSKLAARTLSIFVLLSLMVGTNLAAHAAKDDALAGSTIITLAPRADAAVRANYPDRNFGTDMTFRAQSSPIVRSYLRFNVSNLNGATISSAQLKLFVVTNSTQSASVKAVSNNSWGETTITYNNAPAIGTTLATSPSTLTAGTWITLDVSTYIRASGTYSLALTTANANPIDFAARESPSYPPNLVLTVSGSSPTPTPSTSTSWQPTFPIRAAFYYPWFPEAWRQSGIYPYTNFTPTLGYYSNYDQTLLRRHIGMMQYAKIQAGIASWWGQGSRTDGKIAGLLQAASGTNFRWSLYYEAESQGDPSASQIQNDLTYIRDHYGRDPSFLRVGGKFVVFVYAAGNDACGMADRWKQGNTVGAYVVLKVFSGYRNCASQPDSWHQYSPAVAADRQDNYSYAISPGFRLKGQSVRLARDLTRWNQNVRDMVASGTNWQLVTTFSEWGEGTAVEPAQEWSSASSYGQYLDALHYNGNTP